MNAAAFFAVQLFGIRLVGIDAANGRKILASIVFLAVIWGVTKLVQGIIRAVVPHDTRAAFWSRQFISVAALVLTVVALISVWFNNPKQATTVVGLFSAGLAFALQRVVTSIAGYVLILRGGMFNVGDRIKMGGVRGASGAYDIVGLPRLSVQIVPPSPAPGT